MVHSIALPMLRRSAALVAVVALSAPAAMAGEFFTGTRSTSDRFERTRTSVGDESLTAKRDFKNAVKGSSHKHFANVSASAENARIGQRHYGFIEGDTEVNIEAQGVGAGVFGAGGGTGWGLAGGGFGGLGSVAASAQAGAEIDGMAGTGSEMYLDGSLNASAEWGRADSKYDLSEKGSSVYKMNAHFTEIENVDGTNATGGSVFSFN